MNLLVKPVKATAHTTYLLNDGQEFAVNGKRLIVDVPPLWSRLINLE